VSSIKRKEISHEQETNILSQKEVSYSMIPNPCIEVHTSAVDRPSVPAWFAEVVIIVQHLAAKGLLDAFTHQVRLVRGRFGSYEPLDFLALLIGDAISGAQTLSDFFERLAPFRTAFMALFGRADLPHCASTRSFPGERRSSLPGSLSPALRAAQFCRGVDERLHRGYLGSAGSPLHRL
jgi:hypothetical protein